MKFSYIAPSVLPSRAANAAHVALQCDALRRSGVSVTLYCKRSVQREDEFASQLSQVYGIESDLLKLESFHGRSWADTLRIALLAVPRIIRDRPDAVLSRNLYASFILAVLLKRPLLFETHQLEHGFRKWMQHRLLLERRVKTVVISEALYRYLCAHHRIRMFPYVVAHDAAPEGIRYVQPLERRQLLRERVPEARSEWDLVCGYFGHLYAGRGLEIIEAIADARPRMLFLVYGGTEPAINQRRHSTQRANLIYKGYAPHAAARELMTLFDCLLMPYQSKVAIGITGHDTANWMSPMKMFEYLASGVPVISSDLPVLREVLRHEENSLLLPPADPQAWIAALDQIRREPEKARRMGVTAHTEYLSCHTWRRRAAVLLEAARSV